MRSLLGGVALCAALCSAPLASAQPTPTPQVPTQDQQCADATYSKLHQTICNPNDSPFGMGGTGGGGGSGGGLLGGLLHHLGL